MCNVPASCRWALKYGKYVALMYCICGKYVALIMNNNYYCSHGCAHTGSPRHYLGQLGLFASFVAQERV